MEGIGTKGIGRLNGNLFHLKLVANWLHTRSHLFHMQPFTRTYILTRSDFGS
jgi:hypothetical protein